jgi:hypothetical protein
VFGVSPDQGYAAARCDFLSPFQATCFFTLLPSAQISAPALQIKKSVAFLDEYDRKKPPKDSKQNMSHVLHLGSNFESRAHAKVN